METQKFIIRYGYNDFVFEGSILELADVVRALEKLTLVLFSYDTETYEKTILQKKPLIYSAKEKVEADANNTIYVIDK